jgi:hypothetical protein
VPEQGLEFSVVVSDSAAGVIDANGEARRERRVQRRSTLSSSTPAVAEMAASLDVLGGA